MKTDRVSIVFPLPLISRPIPTVNQHISRVKALRALSNSLHIYIYIYIHTHTHTHIHYSTVPRGHSFQNRKISIHISHPKKNIKQQDPVCGLWSNSKVAIIFKISKQKFTEGLHMQQGCQKVSICNKAREIELSAILGFETGRENR